jgi:N,N'-diacetyllegionaminate synthase
MNIHENGDMTFIIAEIGVNWDGDFELLKEMMIHAKEAGCDAVKFQAFNKNIIGNHPEYERLIKTSVSESNVKKIDELSKLIGIEWFCTPMFVEAVDFLNPYVKRFKMREFDGRGLLENKSSDLVKKILETGKQVIISSNQSLENSKFYNNSKIKWLYCVPKYPCSLEELDFSELDKFDGFSNHCPQLMAPLSAAILGTEIIEIHITSDKTKKFIDNNVSFDYNELTEVIRLIRLSEKIKR